LTALVILVPTILLGGTLPVLARQIAQGRQDFQPALDRLYASNTLGAGLGTLASTYFLMPWLGVRGAIIVACGIDLAIFLSIAFAARKNSSRVQSLRSYPMSRSPGSAGPRWRSGFLVLAAFLTGAVALAYEVLWTHILSFLIGNTVYAFGVMLFTFLLGLGGGAFLVGRYLPQPARWARALAASQLLLALVIFHSVTLWNHFPDLFAQGLMRAWQFDLWSVAFLLLLRLSYAVWMALRRPVGRVAWRWIVEVAVEICLLGVLLSARVEGLWRFESVSFLAGELLRIFSAFYLLIVPCLLLGLSFPLLLNLLTAELSGVGAGVGRVYAANTLGTVLGSLLAGFVLLPAWGSLATMRAAATLNLVLGLGFAFLLVRLSRLAQCLLGLVVALLAMLLWRGPGQWDLRNFSRGTYVYFGSGWRIDQVLYSQEDAQGGLTTVVQSRETRMLLSNGKFQGNNTGERGAQARFAMVPILFTRGFERALVIGLGTGHTLSVLARFPFREIETVEIAPSIVEAARRCFGDVNEAVFDRDPRVKLYIADGRNFLLLSRQNFDLITIEITSIWISGEADLYNQEFYELCRARLTEHGVLQQWVQMHHMRTADLLVILNTAARVFRHVAFFFRGNQGLLIASPAPLACDYRKIEAFDADPGVQWELAALHLPSLASLLGEMLLYDESFRKALTLLPSLSGLPAEFASTDDRPYLEYQTPKGNTLPYDTVVPNVRFLMSFRPPLLPPEMPVERLPSENEKQLLRGYAAEARGDSATATECFRRVRGRATARAQLELRRLEPRQAPALAGRPPGAH
jgi:spermidine synthase